MLGAAADPDDCRIIRIADVAMPADIAGDSCGDVYDRLSAERDAVALPMGQDESRRASSTRLTMSLAQDYGRALYSKKPISVRMGARPRLVDSETAIDELGWMIAANQPSALTRGYTSSYGEAFTAGAALTLPQPGMRRSEQRTRQPADACGAAQVAKSCALAVMSHELRTPLTPAAEACAG